MELVAIIIALVTLFILIGTGYAARKYGILNGDRVHLISHVLVNVALPALSISSLQVPETATTMGIVDVMLLVAVAYYLAAFVVGILFCRLVPSTAEEKGVFQFMLVFPNTMFMGIPVALAVLGPSSLFYVILFNVPFYFLVFTLGVWLLARGRPGKIDLKVLLSPGLVAAIVGLVFFLLHYTIPAPVEYGLDLVGSATTPLAMLVVGAMLATLPLERLAGDWRVYLVTALRLLVLPVAAFLVLSPFIADKLLLGVAVLLIAMPVAANSVLLSEEYKVDATLASQGVFISTLLCLATIPLLELLLF
ncbi:AEC family transporter [Methanoregula sp.]|uniref:AEC family transporter n=1 Tax=Methanoregula sp. TaxID=2052170 RepID=UPI002B528053|nr:AEC family transporter [Methanoregula sp.]HVP97056.1 AEC family transporter [Methanoregula sp.]